MEHSCFDRTDSHPVEHTRVEPQMKNHHKRQNGMQQLCQKSSEIYGFVTRMIKKFYVTRISHENSLTSGASGISRVHYPLLTHNRFAVT